jgi:N-acetylneuraminic acid mutarotase
MVRIRRQRLKEKIAVATTFLVVSAAAAWATPEAAWNPTGSMSVGRFSFTATTLRNGLVLVAGGTTPGDIITNTADLYDPITGVFTPTGSMNQRRVAFSAIQLANGKVLVEGGATDTELATATAELYDPTTGTWSVTGSMNQGRQQDSAVLLRDGTVLVTGGNIARTPCADVCVNTIAESEIYNPSTGQWTTVGAMTIPRSFFTTTLLPNGKVLAVGGRIHTGPDYFDFKAIAFADLYDPTTQKWSASGTMSISRTDHSATLLSTGKVLVAGGTTVDFNGVTVASAELYDPVSGTWTGTGSLLQGRERFTATLLRSGKVLVAGGDSYDGVNANVLTECELYDPGLGTWAATASMGTPRFGAKAALLRNGRVLEVGGDPDFTDVPTASAEVYSP